MMFTPLMIDTMGLEEFHQNFYGRIKHLLELIDQENEMYHAADFVDDFRQIMEVV